MGPDDDGSAEYASNLRLPHTVEMDRRVLVQGVGGELLDGITTVTTMVRYLGLRTWLARRYALARLPSDCRVPCSCRAGG